MGRLLTYLKPHKWVMTAATVLVLFIIVVELYRPIIIGDAIDDYINGYAKPFQTAEEGRKGAVLYNGVWLVRVEEDKASEHLPADGVYYQLFLYI